MIPKKINFGQKKFNFYPKNVILVRKKGNFGQKGNFGLKRCHLGPKKCHLGPVGGRIASHPHGKTATAFDHCSDCGLQVLC